jgi:Skp family chaperone for outer membrane proteins
MKKIIVSALFTFCFMALSLKAADLKIATIDVQQVFKNYYKTQEAEQQLQASTANYKSQYDVMVADYRKMYDQASVLQNELNADSTSSEVAKKDKQGKLRDLLGDIQKKEQEIKSFEQQTSRFVQDQSQRTRKGIVDEITSTISTYSKGKYTVVLDKSGINLNGTPTLLYSEGLADITDDVTKQLNANKPAAGGKPVASGTTSK